MHEPLRSYLIVENKLVGSEHGSKILLPLAVVWANDTTGAMATLLGETHTRLSSLHYVHGRTTGAEIEAEVAGKRRQFRVMATPNVPVPLFACEGGM